MNECKLIKPNLRSIGQSRRKEGKIGEKGRKKKGRKKEG